MPFWVYVLRSESTGRLYKGQTSDLNRRLLEHNGDLGRRRFTRNHPGPWKLVFSEQFDSREQALNREKWLKSGHGRDWLNALLNDTDST